MQTTIILAAIAAIAGTAFAVPQGPIQPCTTTLFREPHFGGLDKTSTVYASTATETNTVDCQGCGVVVVTTVGGHGPARPSPTTTITLPVTTTEAFVCSATPY